MTTKNNLMTAPSADLLARESIFRLMDAYFAEGQAEISMEVSRDEILSELAPEVNLLTSTNKRAELAEKSAASALEVAKAALEEAKRKSGGVFTVEIKKAGKIVSKVENPHKQFSKLLAVIASGCHAYLAGPAGSGKTTAAEQVAKSLSLPFHFTGAVATEFQLTGFVDARGTYHETPFRRWCVEGGVFLWDEIDASDARALLRFNAALANGICEFPDGQIVRLHESCVAIAAANTYGQGADRVYVGRNQLDGASLDRFVFLSWEYDTDLEKRIAGPADWTARVQAYRAAVEALKIRAVISPRASIFGNRLLAQGLSIHEVEEMTIFKGMDSATVAKIRAQVRF